MASVNLIGLAVTVTVVIMIGLLLHHEFSYERSVPNSEQIAMLGIEASIGNGQTIVWSFVAAGMPIDIKNELANVEDYCRIDGSGDSERLLTHEGINHLEKGVVRVDSSFFNVTGIQLSQGDVSTALSAPGSVVITRDAARSLFGDENPIGKQFNELSDTPLTITGVIEEMPSPSFMEDYRIIYAWSTSAREGQDENGWLNNVNWTCMLQLSEGLSAEDVKPVLDACAERHTRETIDQIGGSFEATLVDLRDVHLFGHYGLSNMINNRWNFVLQFIAVGVFLLLIAIMNYVNLTTAQSTRRGVFVGISKTMGARRRDLIKQFMSESVMFSLIATFVGAILASLLLPNFSQLVGVEIDMNVINNPFLILYLLLLGVGLGLVSGVGPALMISGFKPINVIRKEMTSARRGSKFRSALVILQFTVAAGLILSSIVVMKQMSFIRNTDIGFNRENVLTVRLNNWDLMTNFRTLYDEYRRLPFVISSSTADDLPIRSGNTSLYHVPGMPTDAQVLISTRDVDHNYLETLEIELVAGRNFNPDISLDSTDAFIVNRAASVVLGYGDDPVGKTFETITNLEPVEFEPHEIIGMIDDFNYESLRTEIKPLMLRIYRGFPPWLIFRLQPGTEAQAIAKLEEMWPEFANDIPLNYSFLDEHYDAQYEDEQKLSELFNLFTIVAIIVASMGLFALVAFAADRRTKEIGIRKVLGATSRQIVSMLVIEFLRLVLIANIISWPLSAWLMSSWLKEYAFRTELSWWLFALTAGMSILLAIITVSMHALKAAMSNPSKAIRCE